MLKKLLKTLIYSGGSGFTSFERGSDCKSSQTGWRQVRNGRVSGWAGFLDTLGDGVRDGGL